MNIHGLGSQRLFDGQPCQKDLGLGALYHLGRTYVQKPLLLLLSFPHQLLISPRLWAPYLQDKTDLLCFLLTSGDWPQITSLGLFLPNLPPQPYPMHSRGSLAQWETFLPMVLQRKDKTKQIPAHGQGAKAGIFM